MKIKTILVTSRDQNIQRLARQTLDEESPQFLEAENEDETLTIIEKNTPDLWLYDFRESDQIERDILKYTRKQIDQLIILLIADTDSKQQVLTGLNNGADGYLIPPIEPGELQWILGEVQEKQRLANENNHLQSKQPGQEESRSEEKEDPVDRAHLFHVLMNHISDAIYFKDQQSRFLYINPACAEKHGLEDPQIARGKTDYDFFSYEHAQEAYEDEQQIMESGEAVERKEEKETWHSGETTWASTTKAPLIDPNGEIIGTFGISRDITRRKKAENALRRHVQEMEKDLERARVVQEALLPSSPPDNPHANVAFRFLPHEIISGDHLSFFNLRGERLGIFVGDVSGHGVSAALYMSLIKFLTDRLSQRVGSDPEYFLQNLNEELLELDAHPSKFVTGIYGILEPDPKNTPHPLTIAKGGHPNPILLRNGDDLPNVVSLESNAALGILPRFQTKASRINLNPGDRLFLYTDGLYEARSSEDRIMGNEKLLEIIQESQTTSLEDTLDRVIEGARERIDEEEFDDDVVLCGIEMKG